MKNFFKFLCFLLIIYFTVSQKSDKLTFRGLGVSIKKTTLAKDMLFIIKTIIQNAKYGDYNDIISENNIGFLKQGLYITNIEISKIQFDTENLSNNLNFISQNHTAYFYSTEPILRYSFNFKWAIKISGVHISFGSGSADFISNEFYSYVKIDEIFGGSLRTEFRLENVKLEGIGWDKENTKEWISGKFKEIIGEELKRSIYRNIGFIPKYLFTSYETMTKKISESTKLTLKCYPYSMIEQDPNYLLLSFDTKIYINDTTLYTTLAQENQIPEFSANYSTTVFISPYISPFFFGIYAQNGDYDGIFDLKNIGFSNTVKDFQYAIPELGTKYQDNENVTMNCNIMKNLIINELKIIEIPINCIFTVEKYQESFMRISGSLNLQYWTKSENMLFDTELTFLNSEKITNFPHSIDVAILSKKIINLYGEKKFSIKTGGFPKIRYIPLRDFSQMTIFISDNIFASIYKE